MSLKAAKELESFRTLVKSTVINSSQNGNKNKAASGAK